MKKKESFYDKLTRENLDNFIKDVEKVSSSHTFVLHISKELDDTITREAIEQSKNPKTNKYMTTKKRTSKKKEVVEQKEVIVPQSVIDDVVKISIPIKEQSPKKENLIAEEIAPGEDFSDYSVFDNLSKEELMELAKQLGIAKAGKEDIAPKKEKSIQGVIIALSAVDNEYGFPTGKWKLTVKEDSFESDESLLTDIVINTEEFSEKKYVIGDIYSNIIK